MKATTAIFLLATAGASAEGVFSGAPNPGWVRHTGAGVTGQQLLLGMAGLLVAMVLLCVPRRDRPVGVRLAVAPAGRVTPALLLPVLGLLALGELLVWLRQGNLAAYAAVLFATVTGAVLLHGGGEWLDNWRGRWARDLESSRHDQLESGLLAFGEIAVTVMLLFLLAFLPRDCSALGLLMFALAQSLVAHANGGRGERFRERLAEVVLRGNAVLVALILLLQTGFEPTSIEVIVLVEFYLAVRMVAPALLLLARRSLLPGLTEGLSVKEAEDLSGWMGMVTMVAAVCGVGFVLLDRFCAVGFFIHRDLWWSLPLSVCLGILSRLLPARGVEGAGLVFLGGLLLAHACFQLQAMEFLVSGTHGAMAWGLVVVLVAWGWSLGDQCRSANPTARPEVEVIALAGVALILLQDWFEPAVALLSLLDFKVVVGVLLGALLGQSRAWKTDAAAWRLSGLAFVFPVLGTVVGLPTISVFAFASGLFVFAATSVTSGIADMAATRARLHFVLLAGLPGIAIAVEVLRRFGNAGHAWPARVVLAGAIVAAGFLLGWLCRRADRGAHGTAK